jgi:hypothetical protein
MSCDLPLPLSALLPTTCSALAPSLLAGEVELCGRVLVCFVIMCAACFKLRFEFLRSLQQESPCLSMSVSMENSGMYVFYFSKEKFLYILFMSLPWLYVLVLAHVAILSLGLCNAQK